LSALLAACKAAATAMAGRKATLCTWLGCPGLLGCFVLGFLAGEYRATGAQPTAFALHSHVREPLL